MDFFSVLSMIGGLALFLYGMHVMGDGLSKVSGGKMEKILEGLTSNPLKAVGLGALVTAVIQSSSATTVMVVGFVNSGIMKLSQAVGVIMGANIGTTITSWILSLSGIESDSFFIQMFKPTSFSPILAIIGVAFLLFAKSEKKKDIGTIFLGFAVLMFGMDSMSAAVKPLADVPEFTGILTAFSNPILGMLAGALLTAVIQSSSASVGILQALAGSGLIGLSNAVYVLFGQNIGTCITAILAAIGTSRNAKRTTVIHLMFNLIGTVLFTVVCIATPLTALVESITPDSVASQIANMHTLFNIVTTLLLLPFGNYLAKAAVRILPEKQDEQADVMHMEFIHPMETKRDTQIGLSAIAVTSIKREIHRMIDMAKENVEASFQGVKAGTTENLETVKEREEYIDFLNKEISKYISKVLVNESNPRDSQYISALFKVCGNVERIGDHAMNICGYTKLIEKQGIVFSQEVRVEIDEMQKVCIKALDFLNEIHHNQEDNNQDVKAIEKIEQQIDDMTDDYRQKQLIRMQKGTCSEEGCIIYSEMLTDFERIGDHILNIGQEMGLGKVGA